MGQHEEITKMVYGSYAQTWKDNMKHMVEVALLPHRLLNRVLQPNQLIVYIYLYALQDIFSVNPV